MPEPWEAVEAHSDYSSTASPVPGSGFSQAWAESLEAMTPSRRRRADVDEAYELQTKAAVEVRSSLNYLLEFGIKLLCSGGCKIYRCRAWTGDNCALFMATLQVGCCA